MCELSCFITLKLSLNPYNEKHWPTIGAVQVGLEEKKSAGRPWSAGTLVVGDCKYCIDE